MGLVNPHNPEHHNKPLWVVYGDECAPSLMCVKLAVHKEGLILWGYSVYEGEPGFRTHGSRLSEWAKKSSYGPLFFDSQEAALGELRRVTTPLIP